MIYSLKDIGNVISEVNLLEKFGNVEFVDKKFDGFAFLNFNIADSKFCILVNEKTGFFEISGCKNSSFDNIIYDEVAKKFMLILKHKVICTLSI